MSSSVFCLARFASRCLRAEMLSVSVLLAVVVAPAYVDGRRHKVWLLVCWLEQGSLGLAVWKKVDDDSDECLGMGIDCKWHARGALVVVGSLCASFLMVRLVTGLSSRTNQDKTAEPS